MIRRKSSDFNQNAWSVNLPAFCDAPSHESLMVFCLPLRWGINSVPRIHSLFKKKIAMAVGKLEKKDILFVDCSG